MLISGKELARGWMRPVRWLLGISAVVIVVSACVDLRIRAGNEIALPALENLQVGVSTSSEVREVLGDPYGTGRSYLPFQSEQIDMWSYYYELGTMSDDRRTFLFVYLDEGVFDGYMWFSSLPETLK